MTDQLCVPGNVRVVDVEIFHGYPMYLEPVGHATAATAAKSRLYLVDTLLNSHINPAEEKRGEDENKTQVIGISSRVGYENQCTVNLGYTVILLCLFDLFSSSSSCFVVVCLFSLFVFAQVRSMAKCYI